MIAAHALPLSSRPAARTDIGELPCPPIPLRLRTRPSHRCSTTSRLLDRSCRPGPHIGPRPLLRPGLAPGIPRRPGPTGRRARCYRHRCGRPRCSRTRRCAESWRWWTGVGRQRICNRCWPPDWRTRWRRLAGRRSAESSRPPCSGYAYNRQVQANRQARWRFSAPTGADRARMHWPAVSSPCPAPEAAQAAPPGGSSPCTSASADRKRGEATRSGSAPSATADRKQPAERRRRPQFLRGTFGNREPRPSRRAASRRSRRDVAPAGCRSPPERRTCAEPSSAGPE